MQIHVRLNFVLNIDIIINFFGGKSCKKISLEIVV